MLQAAGAAEAGISGQRPETRSVDKFFNPNIFYVLTLTGITEPLQGSVFPAIPCREAFFPPSGSSG